MKILLCPDKFRGSLTAQEACLAMKEGIFAVNNDVEVISLPMADGGEGTLELLNYYAKSNLENVQVQDPLGRNIMATLGFSPNRKEAIIEMAKASGLDLLQSFERNPLKTSTFGTGQLIKYAIENGATNITIGIGGSATNDAGMGMAAALGMVFLDSDGKTLSPSGENLLKIAQIDDSNLINLEGIEIKVACDVTNPLFGINGAAYIYAPQKGANKTEIVILDEGLQNMDQIVQAEWPQKKYANIAGVGAAGGLGYGLMVFLGAELVEGSTLMMQASDFQKHLENTDFVLTGEGKIDQQTINGKLIKGICQHAKAKNVPVIAFCGTLDIDLADCQSIGLSFVTSILTKPCTLDNAQENAFELLKSSTAHVFNLIQQLNK